jgi:U4/U6.U5 tri-snRNP-associated protein 3
MRLQSTPQKHLPYLEVCELASYLLAPSCSCKGSRNFLQPRRHRLPHPTHHITMSDNERPRDRFRERDGRRKPRYEQESANSQRPNRSRSPPRGGGQRGDNRYRSRSPVRKDDRERDGAREPRGRGRGGHDRDQDSHRRDAPRGPRGGGGAPPSGPRKSDFASRGGPVKPPSAPRDVVKKEETPDVEMREDAQKPEDMEDDTWEMQKMMGFAGFKSTKNRKVPGNDKNYGVRKDKTMEARQYMNRQGGFNRPLSPSRG